MTLIEALNHGRRIRNLKLDNHKYKKWHFNKSKSKNIVYDVQAVLSKDWEVEDPKVIISKTDLETAWMITFDMKTLDNVRKRDGTTIDILWRELNEAGNG